MSDAIQIRTADGVAVITIDRPQVKNAVDRPTAEAIADALDQLDRSDELASASSPAPARSAPAWT